VYQSHNQWQRQCATRFDPVIHVAISSVSPNQADASLIRVVVATVWFLTFDHRTTRIEKLVKIAHSPPRQIRRDCLSNGSRALTRRLGSVLMPAAGFERKHRTGAITAIFDRAEGIECERF
jgi:hypothetical protein